jgi:hypothetical protein
MGLIFGLLNKNVSMSQADDVKVTHYPLLNKNIVYNLPNERLFISY